MVLEPRVEELKQFSNAISPVLDPVLDKALEDCVESGYKPLFMTEIIQRRITEGKEHLIWINWYDSVSLKATGKTRNGNPVVVFAHVENYFSDYRNIRKVREEGKIVNGAGILPEDEFYSLLDREDSENVFVVDHQVLKAAPYGWTNVDAVRGHPMLKPFLGVSDNEVHLYLQKHESIFGKKIGVGYVNDLTDTPKGRLLFLAYDNGDGLSGSSSIDNFGRFVGLRTPSVTGSMP